MTKIILTITDENQQNAIDSFLKKEKIEHEHVPTDQVVKLLSVNPSIRAGELREEMKNTTIEEFEELIEDFFDIAAIEIAKNNKPLPDSIRFDFGSEYDDEGGTDATLIGVHFYDANRNELDYDFNFKHDNIKGWHDEDSYTVEIALIEEIDDSMSINDIEEIYWGKYIPINRGV